MKNNIIRLICVLLILVLNINTFALAIEIQNNPYINQLKFEDYIELNKNKDYKKEITENLIKTPIIDNTIHRRIPYYKKHEKIGKYIRVAQWDLNFNLHQENIENAFLNPDKLITMSKEAFDSNSIFFMGDSMIKKKNKKNPIIMSFENVKKQIKEESAELKKSDIVVINNIDIGMPRTNYKNCPKELAKKLGYNYVFAPEFLEIDPATLGIEKFEWSEASKLKEYGEIQEYKVDKKRYKGLNGTAILSKHPLKNIRIIPLTNVYDWYENEKTSLGIIENHFRIFKKKVFKETIARHIRIGRRMAILADIKLPNQTVTIVATQIETRTRANERAKQMKELFSKIKHIKNPVILAGNLSTSSANQKPRSAKTLLSDTFTDGDSFIQTAGAVAAVVAPVVTLGFGLKLALSSFDVSRKMSDPTVISIPYFSPNREKKMFNAIKKFRFDDGYAFDARGNKETSYNGSSKKFSSSNQRALKGFVATYQTNRNIGAYSNYKLAWILAKGYNKKPNKTKHTTEKMAPHFGRTLHTLNYKYKHPLAMQAPIIADFPLYDYKKESL